MKVMRVVVRPRSGAEAKRHPRAALRGAQPTAIVSGLLPAPKHDLKFRGGRTLPHLSYVNFFVAGTTAWQKSDVDNINRALADAMSDPKLNNVMRQYFGNEAISTNFVGSHLLAGKKPKTVTETSAKKMVTTLFNSGQLTGLSLPSSLVNLLLPSGTILTDGTGPGKEHDDDDDDHVHQAGAPEAEEASSLEGLGGYHGSVDVNGQRIYYAVGVYSERRPNGHDNGIVVFDQPWKNVVGTFYHELNEARTDPDVDDAIKTGKVDNIIGWNSDDGEECGDFPVFEAGDAGNLGLVFKEVPVQGGGTAPVQFQYSNAVHGPEGPIAAPHPLSAHQVT
jgi:hypothetical protein